MKSNLERAKAHLERAYKDVSSLKVSGDVVDTVYEIREALRQAYRMVCEGEASAAAPKKDHTGRPLSQPAADSSPFEGEPLEEDRGEEVSGDAAAEDEV